jgi:hypothetical protein
MSWSTTNLSLLFCEALVVSLLSIHWPIKDCHGRNHASVPPGALGFARHQRSWASLSSAAGDVVIAVPFDLRRGVGDDYIIGSMTVEVRFLQEKPTDVVFEAEALEKFFRQASREVESNCVSSLLTITNM